jgi:hypothetical protein
MPKISVRTAHAEGEVRYGLRTVTRRAIWSDEDHHVEHYTARVLTDRGGEVGSRLEWAIPDDGKAARRVWSVPADPVRDSDRSAFYLRVSPGAPVSVGTAVSPQRLSLRPAGAWNRTRGLLVCGRFGIGIALVRNAPDSVPTVRRLGG